MDAGRRNRLLIVAAGGLFLLALAIVLVVVLLPDEPVSVRGRGTVEASVDGAVDGGLAELLPDLGPDAAPRRPDARPRPRRGWRQIGDRELRTLQRRNSPLLRACYARLAHRAPSTVRGRANVTVELGERGRVKSVAVSAGDRELEGCLRRAVLRWHFSPALKPQRIQFPVVVAGR